MVAVIEGWRATRQVTYGRMMNLRPLFRGLIVVSLVACARATPPDTVFDPPPPRVSNAAFVVTPGVYNSELMAPYDVFHHTYFRDKSEYIAPFIVAADTRPLVTFEGITVLPHYTFDEAPKADILVIPSTKGSMDRDLEDGPYMRYVARAVAEARWVITVCDGAFVLAATGALDGRVATTFPADRAALRKRFPKVDVRDDVRLVVDGKFITSVGGGLSYEPAFFLVEHLWGPARVAENAKGLVWPWNLASVPHVIVGQ